MTEQFLSRRGALAGAATMAAASMPGRRARAQAAGPIRIGVLTDQSGPYADSSGPGSVAAARLAAQEFGAVLGQPVEILQADTQNKTDVASVIARRWYDTAGVDAIIDLPVTSIAAAVQQVALEKSRIVAVTAAASADLTGKSCFPVSSHWADDTTALSSGMAAAVTKGGGVLWYFITVDYTFGDVLQNQATSVLVANGGRVVGSARFPLGTTDFSSMIVRAQASEANVIALAAVGSELVNLVKQLSEFGVSTSGKQVIATLTVLLTDVHALGLRVAGGLNVVSSFYWDDNDLTRQWSRKFEAERKAMPTRVQAQGYLATRHILRCMQSAGTRDALAVNRAIRATPVDYFGRPTTLRGDGRLMSEIKLYRIKTVDESKGPWDYYKLLGAVAPDLAYAPIAPACAT